MASSPVLGSDFRLERMRGQPPDTAVTSLDSSRSISWVMVSFTALSTGSISIVQRLGPSALSSGFHSFCQRMTMRRGGHLCGEARPADGLRAE
jgi:hypothetical protein